MRAGIVWAIDPGPVRSSYVRLASGGEVPVVLEQGELDNEAMRGELGLVVLRGHVSDVAIERIDSYGMPVGREVFDTILEAGRFVEVASRSANVRVQLIPRRDIKLAICGSARARDANVRAALLDRFGGRLVAQGRRAAPGPLYGVSGDRWAALAVAVAWAEGWIETPRG